MEIPEISKIQRVVWNEENIPRPECGNRINKENPNWGKSGNEKFRNLNGNLQGSFTNKIKESGEKISGTESMIEEMDTSVEENVKSNKKKSWQEHWENFLIFKYRGRRRNIG